MELHYCPHFGYFFPRGSHNAKGTRSHQNENQNVLEEASNIENSRAGVVRSIEKVAKV